MGEARQGVAHLAEVAAGVDLVRVQVADHLDVVRREELERAEHLAAAQTHKHTTDNVRDPSHASEALQARRRRQARTRTCGSWRLLFCCFVAYPYRYSDYPYRYSNFPYRYSDNPLPLDRVDRAAQNDDLLLEAAVSRRGD